MMVSPKGKGRAKEVKMEKNYSVISKDYELLEEVGYGASATVYRAIYLPFREVVAVKCLDLDRCNSNLDDIRREAQTMSLIDHPNVIKSFCSFVVDHNLWVVMPFMDEGSCLHLMKIAYPEGLEESAIRSILKETLKALKYLHKHGHIHRDVKAGNILVGSAGEVKLGDFGVSACMYDRGDRQRSRNTFVGTPCWMAPEVLQPGTGYDFKADIWSFGITALELARGHAPFSKYPPMKVLLMTIQNAPPGLDRNQDKRFSKSFKEMVAMCLVKDQTKRPTAEKLLKHSFFKSAKSPQLSVKKLFAGLPPLWRRVKDIQLKDAAQFALKKLGSGDEEALSQSEYQRGVSTWNFDVDDLKLQASLLQEEDGIQEIKEEDNLKFYKSDKVASISLLKSIATSDNFGREITNDDEVPVLDNQTNKGKVSEIDNTEDDNMGKTDLKKAKSKSKLSPPMIEKETAMPGNQIGKPHQTQSGPLMPLRKAPSFSGPLNLPNQSSANSLSAPTKSPGGFKESFEDKSKTNLVQIKGRFSVTSENVDIVKDISLSTVSRQNSPGSPLARSASIGSWIPDSKQMPSGLISPSILIPHLQNLSQQTSFQQDLIMNLLSSMQTVKVDNAPENGKLPPSPSDSENKGSVEPFVSERERMLLLTISELQARVNSLTDELTAENLKHTQLLQQLNAVSAGNRMEIEEEIRNI